MMSCKLLSINVLRTTKQTFVHVVVPITAHMGNFKKNGCFYILPNYFEGNTFQDQPIILKDDYDGQFFAQCTFGSHSVNI